jgi:hypothetical protein
MKRKTRKSGKKLPMLWDSAMDFEVAIRPLATVQPELEFDPELETKIIMFPLPVFGRKFPKNPPPPLAA